MGAGGDTLALGIVPRSARGVEREGATRFAITVFADSVQTF